MTDTFSKEDVDSLKDEEQTVYEVDAYEMTPSTTSESRSRSSRHNEQSFFPLILIGIGGYFLLRNFGYVTGTLNWSYLFSLWPMILIFLGVNALLENWRTGIGRLVRLVWFLCGMAFFGYAMYFGDVGGLMSTVGFNPAPLQSFPVNVEMPQDMELVSFDLDFPSHQTDVYALEDSTNLLDGTVYATDDADVSLDEGLNGRYTLSLDTDNGLFGGVGASEETVSRLGLHPNALYDLKLDLASGVANVDLSRFRLRALEIDGGSGVSQITLPNGDYRAEVDMGSGRMDLTLGEVEQIEIKGGSGMLALNLPTGVDVRINIEGGSGSVNIDHPTLQRIYKEGDDMVWQTSDNYDMEIFLEIGSGRVTIE